MAFSDPLMDNEVLNYICSTVEVQSPEDKLFNQKKKVILNRNKQNASLNL